MIGKYATGYRAERELKLMHEANGAYVMTSRASKGPFDMAVFFPNETILIEVKVIGKKEKRKFTKLRSRLAKLPVGPKVRKQLWVREKETRHWTHYEI